MSAAVIELHPRDVGEIESTHPLIPEGEYRLRYLDHSTAIMFGRAPKVILRFSILDMGAHFEVRLCAFYNARRLIGRTGRGGRFKAGANCSLVRDVARLVGGFNRLDRIPLSRLADHVIVGRVVTVTRGHDQRDIPECLRYSIVQELVRVDG